MDPNDKKLSVLLKKSKIIIYQSPDGTVKVETRMQGETVWLSQLQMEELFGRDKSVINFQHLNFV